MTALEPYTPGELYDVLRHGIAVAECPSGDYSLAANQHNRFVRWLFELGIEPGQRITREAYTLAGEVFVMVPRFVPFNEIDGMRNADREFRRAKAQSMADLLDLLEIPALQAQAAE